MICVSQQIYKTMSNANRKHHNDWKDLTIFSFTWSTEFEVLMGECAQLLILRILEQIHLQSAKKTTITQIVNHLILKKIIT